MVLLHRSLMIVCFCTLFFTLGCSKEEPPPPPAETTAPKELPVLKQNQIQTPYKVKRKPDFSFHSDGPDEEELLERKLKKEGTFEDVTID